MSAADHHKTLWLRALIAMPCLSVLLAPSAVAQPAPELAQVVTVVRSSSPCPPLNFNPTVEHAAEIVNQSTYAYLNHTAENVPADDPHPTAILKDLGINSSRALSLQGAAHDEAGAIKGVLLQGRNAIPDCSYTDFGVSLLHEEQTNYFLAVVVLVGT
jgi:hypothetical protein